MSSVRQLANLKSEAPPLKEPHRCQCRGVTETASLYSCNEGIRARKWKRTRRHPLTQG
jgi:hypothetical protein